MLCVRVFGVWVRGYPTPFWTENVKFDLHDVNFTCQSYI